MPVPLLDEERRPVDVHPSWPRRAVPSPVVIEEGGVVAPAVDDVPAVCIAASRALKLVPVEVGVLDPPPRDLLPAGVVADVPIGVPVPAFTIGWD